MADTQERSISGLTVVIERDRCIGSGICVVVAPDVFELDATNTVTFRPPSDEASASDLRDQIAKACKVCPVEVFTAS